MSAADEAVVVLADGTTNALSDGSCYGDDSDTDAPNAALYSMADLTITGTGASRSRATATTASPARTAWSSSRAPSRSPPRTTASGARTTSIIEGGTVTVDARGDALKSDNETDDTVGYISVTGGKVTVAAGDDGVHAEGDLADHRRRRHRDGVERGSRGRDHHPGRRHDHVTASDDGVNVSIGTGTSSQGGGPGGGGGMQDDGSLLTISGGTNTITSEGDGLDSNGSTVITGGTTVVNGPTGNGNGALDSNGGIAISGGTLVAAGSGGMAEAPDAESSQSFVQASRVRRCRPDRHRRSGDTVVASVPGREGAGRRGSRGGITSASPTTSTSATRWPRHHPQLLRGGSSRLQGRDRRPPARPPGRHGGRRHGPPLTARRRPRGRVSTGAVRGTPSVGVTRRRARLRRRWMKTAWGAMGLTTADPHAATLESSP